jgi:hypothetical protein
MNQYVEGDNVDYKVIVPKSRTRLSSRHLILYAALVFAILACSVVAVIQSVQISTLTNQNSALHATIEHSSSCEIICPTSAPTILKTPKTPALTLTPFCPFITQSQIEELKTIQGVDKALQKVREFSPDSKYWKAGEKVPANVIIATDLKTVNYQDYAIPINNQGGWGLFYTRKEITTPSDGAYWCVK